MKNKSAVTDEEIIAALMTNSTIKKAAEAVNLSERSIYDRMAEDDFKTAYKGIRTALLRNALISLQGKAEKAAETITKIMDDEENSPGVRLQAARMILDNVCKFTIKLQETESDEYNWPMGGIA